MSHRATKFNQEESEGWDLARIEKVESYLDEMYDALKDLGYRREAFFGLLGTHVFLICDPLGSDGEVPLPEGMPKFHHILPDDWESLVGLSRRAIHIKPSAERRFHFWVEQYGTALEIRVDGYGSNDTLVEAIEEVLLIIETTLNVTVRRSSSETSIIVRLDAERLLKKTLHLEEAMRAVSLIFDQAVACCGVKSLH